ncbi:MAG: translation initiation factor IF-2 subunit alpha, partial [Halobacteriales archaeon]
KTAESELEAAAERARERIKDAGGTGQFHRERHSDEE